MMRKFGFLSAFAAFFASVVVVRASTPTFTLATACQPFKPLSLAGVHLGWISSAVYVPSLSKILVIDSALNRVLLVDRDGKVTALGDPAVEKHASLPGFVAATPQGFVLELITPDILQFDKGLHLRTGPRSLGAAGGRPPKVGSVFQMTVAAHSLVAYGALRSSSFAKGFEVGFLRVSLSHPSDAEMLLRFELNNYYLFGYQYLASIGPTAYFLRMGDEATLFRVPAGMKPLARSGAVPRQFRRLPKLQTHMDGPADAPAFFAEVEQLTIPAGLYGGLDGYLYLLTRQPARASSGTDWWLYRLTPEGNRVLGSGQLPTHAKHLTVVPSPDRWFFFERGEVDSIGRQRIETLVAVPSSSLTTMKPSTELCPALSH
jgi:hypothetical protein